MAVEDVRGELIVPQVPDASLSNYYADPFNLFSVLSPSDWIDSFLQALTGWDPLGYLSSSLAGEWEAFARCGVAYGQIARACQDLGVNIQEGEIRLDRCWDGNANDAAHRYFCDLASSVSAMQIALNDAAENYAKASQGAWLAANQVKNVLESILDSVVIAAACTAAGTAAIETGVGTAVGYGLAALEVVRITELLDRALKVIQVAGTPLPDAAYDHPAVS
jgi:hypothetical protein